MKKIFAGALILCFVFTSLNITAPIFAEDNELNESPLIGHRVLNYNFVDNDKTMTDEELFGKYDAATQQWVVPGKFDYDAFPKMDGVKTAAMDADGDYALAKELFKEYYKEKKRSFNVTAPDNSISDDLASKVHSEQLYFGSGTSVHSILTLDNNYSTVEADITSRVNRTKDLTEKSLALVIMGLRKDGSCAEIDSREAGVTAPTIDVRLSTGVMHSFTAAKDTYVSAGDNRGQAYGTQPVLMAEESVSSIGIKERVDENTKRTSVVFDLSALTANDSVSSATLRLRGRNAAGTGKMYLAVLQTDTANWTEDVTWSTYPNGQIAFSYYGEEYQLNHEQLSSSANIYPNANFRYTEDICRSRFYTPHYNRYYYTKDEFYAQAYIKTVGDFMLQYTGDAAVNSNLDLAGRRMFAVQLPVIIDSKYATAEWVAALAKHLWGAANYMKTRFSSHNNWGTSEAAQLYTIGAYFPEFKDAYDWTTNMNTSQNLRSAAYRVKYLLDENVRADYSCHEHSGSYVEYFVQTITNIFKIGDVTGIPFTLDDDTAERLIRVTKYLVDISGPGFCVTQWGDEGSYTNKYVQPSVVGELFNDPVLLYAGTNGKKGERPPHTSIFYPDGRAAVMRTGWDKSSYYLFTDFGGRSTHGHNDDLSLIVFAKGKYLLSDQSMADYSSDQQSILVSQESHNVVITDGKAQMSDAGLAATVPGQANDWATNEGFDFLAGTIKDKGNNLWKRNVMFLRGDFWIVTDYLTPYDLSKETTHRQLWHMLSNANPTLDEETKIYKSRFDDINIQIVPTDPQTLTATEQVGIQGGGGVRDAKYVDYTKTARGITTFNTVLRPETITENATVKTASIPLPDVTENGASAMSISVSSTQGAVRKDISAVYYIVNDDAQIKGRVVGDLKYDGKMFYNQTDKNGNYMQLNIYKGGRLATSNGKVLFQYDGLINDFSIEYGGKNIYLSSSLDYNMIQWDTLTFAKQENISTVYFNGNSIDFNQTDDYIYFGESPIIQAPSTPVQPTVPVNNGGNGGSGHGVGMSTPQKSPPPISEPKKSFELNKEYHGAYMYGYDNGAMKPDEHITRGEAVAALYRLILNSDTSTEYENKFSDIGEDDFSYEAVSFLSANKIVQGYEDGTFRPKNKITRGEFAKIISNFAPESKENTTQCPYTDIAGSWAREYIVKVFLAGLINGYPDKTFRPDNSITRAEFIVIVNRLLGRTPSLSDASKYENYFTDINASHWAFGDIIEAAIGKSAQEPSTD